ncbi:GFA family protein [Parahaliea maris]|uniref:GFA family protein n=1 Tax=Parahaliea maris TaxID=2716870 RepID=A0A5C8ZS99_9GAMM|nr:GFA family protein [Parahaliea maris]TXS91383.1 GFA family protein [Parahaliea maris]
MSTHWQSLEGGCTCGAVRYRLARSPLFVHCCHCTWCQRETGSAFVLNAMVEAEGVQVLCGEPVPIDTPSSSGKGQVIHRCPECQVALWSCYSGMGEKVRFLRVGTLDEPGQCPPDIHIFTSTRQPWVQLSGEVPVMPEYYRRSEHWPAVSIERFNALRG